MEPKPRRQAEARHARQSESGWARGSSPVSFGRQLPRLKQVRGAAERARLADGIPHAFYQGMTRDARKAGCTFCDLIKGAAEVSICHEDSDAIAFMDIQPVNNGHVLVVPRVHYESIFEVPAELGQHLFKVTMSLAGAV